MCWLIAVCAFTCVQLEDSLISNMLITIPQQLTDREESLKAERSSFYHRRRRGNTIYASTCASLMSLVLTNMVLSPCFLQQESMTVLSSQQAGEKTAPERVGEKQLYDLCPDVMAPYCLLSLSNGSLRTADFIPHPLFLLLQPPFCKQECDNEGENVGECISFGFSLVIQPLQIRALCWL